MNNLSETLRGIALQLVALFVYGFIGYMFAITNVDLHEAKLRLEKNQELLKGEPKEKTERSNKAPVCREKDLIDIDE